MNRTIYLFKKAGGFSLIRNYWKAHVLLYAIVQLPLLGFSTKSLELLQLSVSNRIIKKLRHKYKNSIRRFKIQETEFQTNHKRIKNNTIWICWFQGINYAPSIVQTCVKSIKKNIPDKEIIILDNSNYKDYVSLPKFIMDKYNEGKIGSAHFADLLRLALLIKYGGTWIDSTVLCSSANIPRYMLDSELFLFQTLKPGLNGHPTAISNWFITAYSNNSILRLTYSLLLEYWQSNDSAIDYFIFHDFFQLAIESYPELWKNVVPTSNEMPHILLLRFGMRYDEKFYNNLLSQSCFHKLTYRVPDEIIADKGTIYNHIVSE